MKGGRKMKEHLERAYRLISGIAVKGDAIDTMALARAELRAAYAELEKKEKPEGKESETA